ncbi:MAG: metallophosphoesterase, partial [Verrucomicrobiales bacterium]
LLEFSPGTDQIHVKTYSPTLDQFDTDADSEFSLSVPLDPGFKPIGEVQGVASGSTASLPWSDAALDSDYEWFVTATDPNGRQTPSSIWSFDTASFDPNPPVISGVEAINVTDHAAEITWTTDEIADSLVDYGDDEFYGSQISEGTLVASHSIVISNLDAGQTYHFRVRSIDASGNSSDGTDLTFTTATDDLTPPTPSPLSWASVPTSAGPSAITMSANTASDSSGVEYYFENLTDPSHDSGWQTGATYTDTLLLPDSSYTYRVKARDLSPANNETAPSPQAAATTGAGSAIVTRGPYLQNGKPDGVSIMWRTDNFTNGRVWFGDSPANLDRVVDEPVPPTPLIARGATWSYLDDGSDQGTAWADPAFDDSGWSQGAAQLGYGDGDEETVVSFGSNSSSKHITTYFRHTFTVTDAASIPALELGLNRDDGAVVYLNGIELRRDNLPAGAIGSGTLASSAIGGSSETIFYVTTVDPALLLEGANVIAVEIHQANATSSDISFNLELYEPQPSGGGDGFDHLVRLGGLDPDTTYYYQIGTAQGEVLAGGDSDYHFVTLPNPGSTQPVRIWALGDSGTKDDNARSVRDAYLALSAIEQPADALLMLGDNAYSNGTDSEYQDAVFQDMYEDILRNRVLWSTQGNHDLGAYFDIFDLPIAGEAGGVASGTEDYYSVDYGNVHLICLSSQDTNLCSDPNSLMYQWLSADLLATTQPWIIAYWHHPAYTKGSHDSDNAGDSGGRMEDMRSIALPILEAGGVDLVLSGHSHSYERSMFINGHYGQSASFDSATHVVQVGDGDPVGDGAYTKNSEDGAVYITAGSSGKISGVDQHAAMQIWLNNLGSVIID